MGVMDHHGPLLPLYLAERILMTVHLQYLQSNQIDNYLDSTFMK